MLQIHSSAKTEFYYRFDFAISPWGPMVSPTLLLLSSCSQWKEEVSELPPSLHSPSLAVDSPSMCSKPAEQGDTALSSAKCFYLISIWWQNKIWQPKSSPKTGPKYLWPQTSATSAFANGQNLDNHDSHKPASQANLGCLRALSWGHHEPAVTTQGYQLPGFGLKDL